jgi:hypothetical protein
MNKPSDTPEIWLNHSDTCERPIRDNVVSMILAGRLMGDVAYAPDLFVRCQALPAEFMLTTTAGHMVAAVPLLDATAAILARTLFADGVEYSRGRTLRVVGHSTAAPIVVLLARLAMVPRTPVPETLHKLARVAFHHCAVGTFGRRVELSRAALGCQTPGELWEFGKSVSSQDLLVRGEGRFGCSPLNVLVLHQLRALRASHAPASFGFQFRGNPLL